MPNVRTFFELFNGDFSSGIRIPAIQRDYVQGRDDDFGRRSRESFLPGLIDAMRGASAQKKDLHFIYGIQDGNGDFLPLDGQQRITTLFLIAWVTRSLKREWRFTYEAKRAATYFIRGLLSTECTIADSGKVESFFRSKDWFMPIWLKDPTVGGMISMVKAILSCIKSGEQLDFSKINFSIREIDVSEQAYGQIFLKMNARGKPLTGWETFKAILDEHLPQAVSNEWRKRIEGDWASGIWSHLRELTDNEEGDESDLISLYDDLLKKVVLGAYLWNTDTTDDEDIDDTIEPYRLDEWLRSRKSQLVVKFYQRIEEILEALSSGWDFIVLRWHNDRRCNMAWGKSECNEALGEGRYLFDKDVIQKQALSRDTLVRLFFLVHYYQNQHSIPERRLRVVLNLLDATYLRDLDHFQKVVNSGIAFMNSMAPVDQRSLKPFDGKQRIDEEWKWNLDERRIVEIEKDELVCRGSTRFVGWSKFVDANDLELRLKSLAREIKKDWVSIFCKILNFLPRGQNNELGSHIVIPKDDLWRWGYSVLIRDDVISALAEIHNGIEKPGYPAWLLHFRQLAKDGILLGGLKSSEGWTYMVPEKRLSPSSIRLDYNENECHNRKLLKDEKIYWKNFAERQLLVAKDEGLGYDVWDDSSWWNTKQPTPRNLDEQVEE